MPAVRTTALILRSFEIFETSLVVHVFTRELGKVSALAKGGRRLKGPFSGGLDVLGVSDIVLLHKGTEALDLMTEAAPLERFESFRHDLAALYAGYYVAELLSELTDTHDPHPKLFDGAIVTLRHLGDPVLRDCRLFRFELACLRELGHMPALDACAHCGNLVDDVSQGTSHRYAFGLAAGGLICPECRPGQKFLVTFSGETLDALRVLNAAGTGWRRLEPSRPTLVSLRETLGGVMSHLIGRPPRMLPYLGLGA